MNPDYSDYYIEPMNPKGWFSHQTPPSVDRLQELRSVIEADMNNEVGVKFDLNRWATGSASIGTNGQFYVHTESELDDALTRLDCGTTACALGLAATHPPFVEAGLRMKKYNTANKVPSFWVEPVYQDAEGIEHNCYFAGAAFFGLSPAGSCFLFDPASYRHEGLPVRGAAAEKCVIARIDLMLALAEGLGT